MFRIVWECLFTGDKGHGDAIYTEEQALEVAKYSNEKYRECHHTIEKYEPPSLTLNVKGHRCSYGDLTFVANYNSTPAASAEVTPMASATPVPSASSVPSQPSASLAQEQTPQPH